MRTQTRTTKTKTKKKRSLEQLELFNGLWQRSQSAPLEAVLFARVTRVENERVNAAATRRGLKLAALVRMIIVEWLDKNSDDFPITLLPKGKDLSSALYIRVSSEQADLVNRTAIRKGVGAGELVRTVVLNWVTANS